MSKKEEKKKDDLKCRVFIPYEEATKLTLQEAIDITMEHTQQTNNEMLFFYDVDTKQVRSSITEGQCEGVSQLSKEWGIEVNASFHTHGQLKTEELEEGIIEFKEKALIELKEALEETGIATREGLPEELVEEFREYFTEQMGRCEFSMPDLHTDFVIDKRIETKLGCPFTNEIITLRYDPATLNYLLFSLVKTEQEFKCDIDIGTSVNVWAEKLMELLPQHKDLIEKSRYEWLTKGLPKYISTTHFKNLDEIEDEIGKIPTIQREKWKRK